MPDVGVIYCHTSRTSGKSYVGQTWDLRQRYRGHADTTIARRAAPLLKNAIKSYGWADFEMMVLDECGTQDALDEAEEFWVGYLGTLHPVGYNLRAGGSGGGRFRHTAEAKRKIAEAGRGRKHTPEARRRMSEALLANEEFRRWSREYHRGNQYAKGNTTRRGAKHRPESIQKMREASMRIMPTERAKNPRTGELKLFGSGWRLRVSIPKPAIGSYRPQVNLHTHDRTVAEVIRGRVLDAIASREISGPTALHEFVAQLLEKSE